MRELAATAPPHEGSSSSTAPSPACPSTSATLTGSGASTSTATGTASSTRSGAAHGYQWPFIADKRVHPGLEALYRKYMEFEREWSAHAGVCSSEFHEYLYQQELENIRIFLDGQDQLQALT